MKLDISRLPTEAMYGTGEDRINLASIPLFLRPGIDSLIRARLIKANDSFGFVFGHPIPEGQSFPVPNWNDPYSFAWFVGGWGLRRNYYIANGLRKMRAGLREGEDTLTMRVNSPERFQDVVKGEEPDGSFEWGDFPWGGMTFVRVGHLILPVADSAYAEVEDDAVGKTMGGHVGAEMLKRWKPEEFGPDS